MSNTKPEPSRASSLLARLFRQVFVPYTGHPPSLLLLSMLPMAMVVAFANFLVLKPINDWLTAGHFVFPLVYLISDMINRLMGPVAARRLVLGGFLMALVASLVVATPRIAMASGIAFLIGQWIDIWVFDMLRRGKWWRAPAASSAVASVVDTALFYSLGFAGTGTTWIQWSLTDLAVKLLMIPPLLGVFWFHVIFFMRWLSRRF